MINIIQLLARLSENSFELNLVQAELRNGAHLIKGTGRLAQAEQGELSLTVINSHLTKLATTYTKGTTAEILGCSLLSAVAVQKLRQAKKLKDTDAMIPWHLLVCKPADKDLLEHLTDFIRSTLSSTIQEKDYLLEEPPHYVSRLMNHQGEALSNDEQSMGLAGVMIYREKSQPQ